MKRFLLALGVAVLCLAGCADVVPKRKISPSVVNPLWRSECGDCHYAFPPSMLAADNWQTMMQELKHHFGVDADLSPAKVKEITDYLVKEGAPEGSSRFSAKSLRVTETRFFVRSHGGSSIKIWKERGEKDPEKTASNCVACHKGDDEDLW